MTIQEAERLRTLVFKKVYTGAADELLESFEATLNDPQTDAATKVRQHIRDMLRHYAAFTESVAEAIVEIATVHDMTFERLRGIMEQAERGTVSPENIETPFILTNLALSQGMMLGAFSERIVGDIPPTLAGCVGLRDITYQHNARLGGFELIVHKKGCTHKSGCDCHKKR